MKRTAAVVAFALLSLGATAAFAGSAATTGIPGSKHDITRAGGYRMDDFGRLCIYCHTPHNAETGLLDNAPLWDRENGGTNATVTAYAWSAPANKQFVVTDQLVGPTRLCMSCHDGSIAADSHGPTNGTATGGVGTTKISLAGGRAWSTLEGTHPVGFSYPAAFAARGATELVDPATGLYIDSLIGADAGTWDTLNRTAANTNFSTKKIKDHLYDNNLTCASCHDVHNTNNAANTFVANGSFTPNYFVWAPEKDSALCLSCHVK